MSCLHNLLLDLGSGYQLYSVLIIYHIIHHPESVVPLCAIQYLTSLSILGILNQKLSLPIMSDIHQRQCHGPPGECICHYVLIALDILNLKVIGLDFAHPLLLPLLQ